MSFTRLLVAALILTAPAALADSIEYTLNATAVLNVSSPNDNYYGDFENVSGISRIVNSAEACCGAVISVPDVSVTVPAGDVITSAFVSIYVPTGPFVGTGNVFAIGNEGFGGSGPGLPSVAPTFSTTGMSTITVQGIAVTTLAMVDGDEAYSQFSDLTFDYRGEITSPIIDAGSNWAGYLGGSGQVDVPYSVSLDVTYSPVPEPSTFVLLGTGILGLASAARRKFFHA